MNPKSLMEHKHYPSVNYNVAPCCLCNAPMSFRQIREGVYWLPDMDDVEFRWALYDGFEHRFAHRHCWKSLKEKRRVAIREISLKGQEPRSLGQLV